MSDEDSLSELNIAPQRLMPKVATTSEHNRILNLSAIHYGHTLSTIKAHKVRADGLEERVEALEELQDVIGELKTELVTQRETATARDNQFERAMLSQGVLIGSLNEKFAVQSTGIDLKKAVISGVFALLMAIVAATSGYFMGHTPPGPKYEAPTHEQSVEIDRKYKEMFPENQRQTH